MKPITFEQANKTLTAPKGSEHVVLDLPVCQTSIYNDITGSTPVVVSVWELTDLELEQLKQNKKIWFLCHGTTHPPVLLSAFDLFTER